MIAINLEDVPSTVASSTGIVSVEVAGMLCSMVLILICSVPFIIAKIKVLAVVGGVLGFFASVGMSWMAGWTTLILVIIIAGLGSFGIIKSIWS